MTQTRFGIYGGTFDPPHLGHLILAETAASSLNLATVLFVPAADPPHKLTLRVPASQRLIMVERAIAGNPRFGLSRVDMDRPGPHYSVDMVRLLRQQFPNVDFFFLIGSDSLCDLPTWSRPAELIELATLAVMRRPGVAPDLEDLERHIPGLRQCIEWIDAPLIEISATEIARRITTGQSVRYQVPDAVRLYIEQNGLYRNNES